MQVDGEIFMTNDTPTPTRSSDVRLKASRAASISLLFFLIGVSLEAIPILAAESLLSSLPRSTAETYPFTLALGLAVFGGLLFHLLSSLIALIAVARGKWKDPFAYLALGCNGVAFLLFALV